MKSFMFFSIIGVMLLCTSEMVKSIPTNDTAKGLTSRNNSELILEGMEAGGVIAEFFTEGDFIEALTATAESLNLFLGAIGKLAGLALSSIPTGDSPEMEAMKEKFAEVNTKLNNVTSEYTEVKEATDWGDSTVSYPTYEEKILVAAEDLVKIYKYEGKAREKEIEHFTTQYDKHFDNSLQTLYDAMMNEDHLFLSNILSAVLQQTKNHKRQFEQFSLGSMRLLVQAIMVKISYFGFKTYSTQHLADEWDRKVSALKNRLQEISNEIQATYLTQLREDVEDMIRRSTDLSNEELVMKLHRFITEKYDWRYFFAAVYHNFEGDNNHFAAVCGGHTFFNFYGRNTVIASQDKSLKSQNHQSRTRENRINGVQNDVKNCRAGMKAKNKSFKPAKALVQDMLAKQRGECSLDQLILAVKIHKNFHSHNPNGHRALRKFPDRTFCDCSPGGPFVGTVCIRTSWNHMLIVFG